VSVPGYQEHRNIRRSARLTFAGAAAIALVAAIPTVAYADVTSASDPNALAGALASSGTVVTGAAFVTVPAGTPNGVSTTALAGFPTGDDDSFAVLTTGDVNIIDDGADPNPPGPVAANHELGGGSVRGGSEHDVTVLRVDFTAPEGTNCLRFDFTFLTDEYPEFLGSPSNDAFIAELDVNTWSTIETEINAPDNFAFDLEGNEITVNTTGAFLMQPANAVGTPYNGATPVLTAAVALEPGAHSLFLSIFDQGDESVDSAVFLDNLVVGSAANPETECAGGAQVKVPTTNPTGTPTPNPTATTPDPTETTPDPTATTPGSTNPTPSQTATTPTQTQPSTTSTPTGTLPVTGASVGAAAASGLLLIVVGAALLILARSRRARSEG
jgi:hypothetical protein